MNNASADYIALMARYDALAAELAHEKEQHELAHQAVSALERERDALRALWDRWLAIYAEEHDESCTPENCSMAALVADVRALRTERGADQPEASPAGGIPGFKITLTCAHFDEHGVNDPCWTAMVDRFPHVRGYADGPVEAVRLAAEAAAELWFNDEHRPADQTTEGQGK